MYEIERSWVGVVRVTWHSLSMSDTGKATVETEPPCGGANGEDSSDDEVKFEDTPVVEVHRPKDPRSRAKYNVFSRLLLW